MTLPIVETPQATQTSQAPLHEVVIRFAGDSGDGMQVTGGQFTSTSALVGNDLSTLPDFPAEIRAPAGTLPGVSAFQVRIADYDIHTPGDAPDVLVAMNPAALKKELKELKPNGVILFHVSNRYMNVESLASAVSLDAGLQGLVRYDDNEDATGKASSDYVAAARHKEDFEDLNADESWTAIEKPAGISPWTDDYSNMLTIIRWR